MKRSILFRNAVVKIFVAKVAGYTITLAPFTFEDFSTQVEMFPSTSKGLAYQASIS